MNHKNRKHEYFLKKYPEFEHSISRFKDYIQRVLHNNQIVETRFLLKVEQEILSAMCENEVAIFFSGGIVDATYQKAILIPLEFHYETVPKVVLLSATFNKQFHQIAHKDVLGTLLNQGIQRNRIGDIVINENNIYIACDVEVVPIILLINKIKNVAISFQETTKVIHANIKLQHYEKIMANLRLDVVVASMLNCSRQQAVDLIQAKVVKINGIISDEKAYVCQVQDEIVIRKFGKYRIEKIKNLTKKANLVIEFVKFI